MNGGLEKCPGCGARLEPALVRAIKDPDRKESCPVRDRRSRQASVAVMPSSTLLDAIRRARRPEGGEA